MFTEKNIPRLIILAPIITVILIAFFNIYFFVKTQNNYFEEESIRVENEYIVKQKNILKKEIDYIVNYIEFHVKRNKKLSEDELKDEILRYIETIRYEKHGYVWVHDTSYYLRAHPFRQDRLNTYDINLKDAVGSFITKEFVEKTLKNPNGIFIEYYWQKPKEIHFSKKLGFFRLYKKFNWVIGAGLYVDDIQKSILENKKILEEKIDKYIRIVVFISFFVMLFISFLSFIMSKKITEVFNRYQENVKKKELLLEDLNKNLEKKVQVAIDEAQKKDRAMLHQSRLARMGTMLSMIAHQWRQPLSELSGVLMELETATKFKKTDEKHILNSIDRSNEMIDFMSNTIDDFRNFYKPDKKKEHFLISDACQKAINLVDATLHNLSIDLIFDIKNDKNIYGYPREYSQVILNLISNARDILVEKEIVNPKIYLSIDSRGMQSIVTIKDNAGGIKEENLDLIFDPYYSTKESSKGTGLGLYISKLIIERNMGGELSVVNDKEGATFKIIVLG